MIMKDIFKKFLIIGIIVLWTISYCSGQDNKETLLEFANTLFKSQEYYRAITEYYRFIEYYSDDDRVMNAYIKISECYFYGEQYEDAIKWSEKILKINNDPKYTIPVLLVIGDSYLNLENYKSASESYSLILETKTNILRHFGIAHMRIGKSFLYEGKWNEASEEFLKVSPDTIYFPKATIFAKKAREGNHLKTKNPTVSGFLSLIPGLGYFYTENRQTSLASFLVNGLFIWGSYSSFKSDNEGAGYVLGFFGVGFYLGNIYGSTGSAHKYNDRQKKIFLEEFE